MFHNNPRGRYFNAPEDDPSAVPNRDLSLVKLIRASTAAPTFFRPERIEIAKGVSGAFVDGGVSPYNNPSLLLFMMATSPGYGFDWPVGADALTLVSIGIGRFEPHRDAEKLMRATPMQTAMESLRSVLVDANWQAQAMLQYLGRTATPWEIDSEMGDLSMQVRLHRRC